ncbi:MAG: hypothetical protein DMG33_10280 [Acidobacteria bacterium]|nr:MAG: hypothetical protein DMG33_10280 [Acidobacteriota bacterium]
MPPIASEVSRQRAERRIAVHLPMKVRGRDRRGHFFEEDTSSENLCRSGAAFLMRIEVDPGADLEITIPHSQLPSRRVESDFATHGRIVHIGEQRDDGGRLIGVQFIGPRFQRVFWSEGAA